MTSTRAALPLDERRLQIGRPLGQQCAESQLRMFCICAAMCPNCRGPESAGVPIWIKSVLKGSNFLEYAIF
jgi:hypothetical protein